MYFDIQELHELLTTNNAISYICHFIIISMEIICPVDNMAVMIQMMNWHLAYQKPLLESIMAHAW